MPETIWEYLLVFATGAAGAAFTLALEFYRKKLEFGTDLRQRRLQMYKRLWNKTQLLPKYPRAEVTYEELRNFSKELKEWYFGEGGMYLSRKAQESYVALQETITATYRGYLFNWNEVLGNDDGRLRRLIRILKSPCTWHLLYKLYIHRLIKFCSVKQVNQNSLIEFLKQNFGIEWVKTAGIRKIDDTTIRVSAGKNFLLLRLNNEKTKVNLEIDDGRTREFNVKMENGNIYLEPKNKIADNEYDKIYKKCSALRTELTNDILSRRRLENLIKF